MDDLMGRNEYARHRGCDPKAVDKAESSGRIKAAVLRDADGSFLGIRWRLADELWARNTDAVEAARNGKVPQAPPQAGAGTPATPLQLSAPSGAPAPDKPAEPTGDQGNFLAARVKEAELRGELLELDKLERLGLLVSSEEVEREFAEIFTQLRSNAFRIPDRVAQILSPTDPLRASRVVDAELRKVFDEFSRRLDADAAEGAAERETALP